MWYTSLRGPVSQYKADRHQRHRSRKIPAHAERQELLHPRLRSTLCPAARRRGGHAAPAGRSAQGGGG